MTRTERKLLAVLDAATALAAARRFDSDCCETWDALESAILAAEESTDASYGFEDGRFVRRSTTTEGIERVDSVGIDDIEIIASTIEEDVDHEGVGWFVVDELVDPSGRTWLQCLIAVEYLKRANLLRMRALDCRLTKADSFSADKAIDAFRVDAGLT